MIVGKIYIDGSGWNGRESRACVLISHGEDSRTIVVVDTRKLTCNQMEYEALNLAFLIAKDGDEILTDSQLVVGQLLQNWKVNYPHLQTFVDVIKERMKEVSVYLSWVPREQNLAGKLLE